MNLSKTRYYEVRPGLDTARYLLTYGGLTLLAWSARRRGTRMFAELQGNIDRHVLSEGAFEKGVLELLRDVCTSTGHTDLMIDVGANIGNHTVALASVFERVEAVEPHPVLFRILEANALHNHLPNVKCHNIGLAGEDAQGTLAESAINHGLSRIRERSQLSPEVFGLRPDQFATEHAVTLRSAKDFVEQFGELLDRAFIKIDVEGMEMEIVSALAPVLKRRRPLVGFEWFTSSQPQLTALVTSIPDYDLWGIRVHDAGRSLVLRSIKLLFTGRSYSLERIDPRRLDPVYPLALLVPVSR